MTTPSSEETLPPSPLDVDTLAQRGARARTMATLFGDDDDGPLTLDGYEILGVLGRGGMGVVYRARQESLDRTVAIKRVLPGRLSPKAGAMLRREAMQLAQVAHENIVEIFEVGEHEDTPYFVMEYVPGRSAKAWLQTEPTEREIHDVFTQAGRGLAAAHAKGVLHLDFKPANVLVGLNGVAKVADFGVARFVEAPETLPQGNTATAYETAGTPVYMAPERFSGDVSPKVDQFAFGASMLEALCGRVIFAEGFMPQLDEAELVERLHNLPKGRASAQTLYVLRRACAFDPAHRWPSMQALLEALPPPPRRDRWLVGGMLGAVVVAGVAAWSVSNWVLTPDPCDAIHEERTRVWDVDTRNALLAEPGGDFILERIDAAAGSWEYQRQTICEATQHGDPVAMVDHRMACLDRSWAAVSGAIEAVRSNPARAAAQPTAVTSTVPDLAACEDLDALDSGLPPVPAEHAETVAAARASLARARVLEGLSDLEGADAILNAVEPDLERTDYGPLRAMWLHRSGSVALSRADFDTARLRLEDGFVQASELDMEELSGMAAQDLAFLLGSADERGSEEAERWLRQATALAERATPDIQRRLFTTRGAVARGRGDLSGALAAFEEASALPNPNPLDEAKLLNNTAIILRQLGRGADAEDAVRRAWDLNRTALSNEHPLALASEIRLANALRLRKRFDEALPHARHAEEMIGDANPRLKLEAVAAVAGILLDLDDPQACDKMRTTVALATELTGAEHPMVALHRTNLASCLGQSGELEPAVDILREVVDTMERANSPNLRQARHGLADMLANLAAQPGRTDAEQLWQEAKRQSWASVEATREALGEASPLQAGALEVHGRALLALGEEDESARILELAGQLRGNGEKNRHRD